MEGPSCQNSQTFYRKPALSLCAPCYSGIRDRQCDNRLGRPCSRSGRFFLPDSDLGVSVTRVGQAHPEDLYTLVFHRQSQRNHSGVRISSVPPIDSRFGNAGTVKQSVTLRFPLCRAKVLAGVSGPALGTDRGGRFLHRGSLDPKRPPTFSVVLFFLDLSTRQVNIAGIASTANGLWMGQIGRKVTDAVDGNLNGKRYLIHDRDPLEWTRPYARGSETRADDLLTAAMREQRGSSRVFAGGQPRYFLKTAEWLVSRVFGLAH
jgi:hypothetical protein